MHVLTCPFENLCVLKYILCESEFENNYYLIVLITNHILTLVYLVPTCFIKMYHFMIHSKFYFKQSYQYFVQPNIEIHNSTLLAIKITIPVFVGVKTKKFHVTFSRFLCKCVIYHQRQ